MTDTSCPLDTQHTVHTVHAKPTAPTAHAAARRRRKGLQRAGGALALSTLLAACGGGGGGSETTSASSSAPLSCSVADQKDWMAAYMDDWYFWYRLSPRPGASAYADVESYFRALLYTGSDAAFPADRWSRSESTDSFNMFFGDGSTLGYGISVAGLELAGDASKPLVVRYVEPASPAAAQGVQRGDEVRSINGRSAASLVAADDFALLTANNAGDSITLVLRRAGADRSVAVTAAVFALTPVRGTAVVTSPAGRKLGYVLVNNMISQALAPLDAAFAQFRSAGVQDVVMDLRYNGGGLVSTGATVASYVAGTRGNGVSYARLLYNDKHASSNADYGFSQPANGMSLPRVFVLMGRRTCSASEQVINGLRGAGVQVVAVGETSCGKPVGFLPVSACGRTYDVVNFESVNQRNEGRYFSGFAPTCAVADDVTAAQGSISDRLLSAARLYADSGSCPSPGITPSQAAGRPDALRWMGPEPGQRSGMLAR